MAKQIQIRRGSAASHETFTGAIGELTMDTTNNTLRILFQYLAMFGQSNCPSTASNMMQHYNTEQLLILLAYTPLFILWRTFKQSDLF